MILKGKVKKGLGNASFWIKKIEEKFYKNFEMKLFHGTLNIELEKDLISQLNQYVYADYVILADGRNQKEYDFEKNYMFVIDMYSVYKYITAERRIIKIFDLDDLKDAVDICKQMKKAVCNWAE